jgi:RNA polymerase sigma-70 factor (ECF subfamily)
MEYSIELVSAACNGDSDAFASIYSCIYKDLYRFAFYMLGREEDAKDAVSETVLDAYRGISKLRDYTLFKNWIFKILIIKCKKKLKEYSRKHIPLEESYSHIQIDFDETFSLKAAFFELPKDDRMIVAMSVFAGYNSKEIGEIMHMKPATVRSRLSRALAKLKQRLEVSI